MNDEMKSRIPDAEELKRLIEDAARLLGLTLLVQTGDGSFLCHDKEGKGSLFNPCDPERGDLMKVADAAGLLINLRKGWLFVDGLGLELFHFTKGDHPSKALAVLRAASAVLHSRGGV